jgi:hypothetical protein
MLVDFLKNKIEDGPFGFVFDRYRNHSVQSGAFYRSIYPRLRVFRRLNERWRVKKGRNRTAKVEKHFAAQGTSGNYRRSSA